MALQTKPADRPVVLVEDFLLPSHFKRALFHALFNVFEVPLVLCLPSAVCSLTLTGANTGIVVDIGHTETRVMPVFDHHLISSAFSFHVLGVQDALDNLAQLILSRREELVTSLAVAGNDAGDGIDTEGLVDELKVVTVNQMRGLWLQDMAFRIGAVHAQSVETTEEEVRVHK